MMDCLQRYDGLFQETWFLSLRLCIGLTLILRNRIKLALILSKNTHRSAKKKSAQDKANQNECFNLQDRRSLANQDESFLCVEALVRVASFLFWENCQKAILQAP